MEIDGTFVKEIAELARNEEVLFEVDGKQYCRENMKRVYDDPRPGFLKVNTLSGIIDYINNNQDDVVKEKCLILVESPELVTVYSPVQGEKNDRHVILKACLDDKIEIFHFDTYIPQEAFIISILALFEATKDRDTLVEITGNMTAALTVTGEDNGAHMEKTAHSGVILADPNMKPPNVVNMKPYRTFNQIEQPESSFLFRYRKNDTAVVLALFEADGGAWRIEAMNRIKKYIEDNLEGAMVIA